jgi:hypothetical protein
MLGVIWLSYAFLLSKTYENKKIFIPLFLIFIVFAFFNIVSYFNVENDNTIALNEIKAFTNSINENKSVILSIATDCDTSNLIYSIASSSLKNNIYFIDFRFRFLQLINSQYSYSFETIKYNVENTNKELNSLIESSINDDKKFYVFSRKDYGESVDFKKYFISKISYLNFFYSVLEKSYITFLFDLNFKNNLSLKKVKNIHKSNEDGGLMRFDEGKENYIYEIKIN